MTDHTTTRLQYMTDGIHSWTGTPQIVFDKAHESTLATDTPLGLLKRILVGTHIRHVRCSQVSILPFKFPRQIVHGRRKGGCWASAASSFAHRSQSRSSMHMNQNQTTSTPRFGLYPQFISLRSQVTSSSSSPVRDQIQTACHRLHSRCLLHREAHPTALEPIVRFLPQAATTYLRCDTSATEAKGISRPQVIVATNITEKSLTVGEIVYVIDPAFSKLSMTHELASNRP
ncbi:hypothetical protein PIIN_10670 [Serendipita indica DSM 11827]|uniref:Helicase C-terminal domain-containing protein n=1 Tax=Serendipita indica (strain DSM 11827) TaxID=1109443 RepID=G4TZD8_SERID|nr:hypothetical protein PIIN_10670 [Serendipita indica DSM 11827]